MLPAPRGPGRPLDPAHRGELGGRPPAGLDVGIAQHPRPVAHYVPFALLVGAAVALSADPLAAWTATLAVYGGSVQLTALQMLADGSRLAVTVGSARS